MKESSEKPGYSALRRFLESRPSSLYFFTVNLADRGCGLETADLTEQVLRAGRKIEAEGLWSIRTAVVMPDHLHLVVCLGGVETLTSCLRLLKGRLSPALRIQRLKWQEGFYEHQIRETEDLLPIFLYIFLNPYRAGLLTAGQKWPGYFCCSEDWQWFGSMTRESVPQPEWLR